MLRYPYWSAVVDIRLVQDRHGPRHHWRQVKWTLDSLRHARLFSRSPESNVRQDAHFPAPSSSLFPTILSSCLFTFTDTIDCCFIMHLDLVCQHAPRFDPRPPVTCANGQTPTATAHWPSLSHVCRRLAAADVLICRTPSLSHLFNGGAGPPLHNSFV